MVPWTGLVGVDAPHSVDGTGPVDPEWDQVRCWATAVPSGGLVRLKAVRGIVIKFQLDGAGRSALVLLGEVKQVCQF